MYCQVKVYERKLSISGENWLSVGNLKTPSKIIFTNFLKNLEIHTIHSLSPINTPHKISIPNSFQFVSLKNHIRQTHAQIGKLTQSFCCPKACILSSHKLYGFWTKFFIWHNNLNLWMLSFEDGRFSSFQHLTKNSQYMPSYLWCHLES